MSVCMAGGQRHGKSVQDPAEIEEEQAIEFPDESLHAVPEEGENLVTRFVKANEPIMETLHSIAHNQEKNTHEQIEVANAQDRKLERLVDQMTNKLGIMLERSFTGMANIPQGIANLNQSMVSLFRSMVGVPQSLANLSQSIASKPSNSKDSQQSAVPVNKPSTFVEGSPSHQPVSTIPQAQIMQIPPAQMMSSQGTAKAGQLGNQLYFPPNVGQQNVQPPPTIPQRPPKQEFGLTRRDGRPIYRKPYPEFADNVEYPRNFRIPEFATFSGEGNQSTVEHISRFIVQCGEAGGNQWLKVLLFSNTLTEYAFRWYTNLPANFINSWHQFEEMFHSHFYRTEPEVSMADLSKLNQLSEESVEAFLSRFRKAKHKYHVDLPEIE
ncbi:uncharacterized protein LOC132305003 [Cornus florida]|uniref:uncharacterized protein LOC132305003 n=1 Tax=Cornus florida TaxID=4283 RepID=UPI00289BDC93|nr:uncharacterized protein LOC132305003 [Cornus florida]